MMKGKAFDLLVFCGLIAATLPARSGEKVKPQVYFAASHRASSARNSSEIRPIKRRVGRAVSSTMERMDNLWFVLFQIVMPLCALLFSLMYVRRYKRTVKAASTATEGSGKDSPTDHE